MFHWVKQQLKMISLFSQLSDEELEALVHIATVRTYKPKMLVFMQGEPLDRVFFIARGTVKIYKTDVSGKEQIVSILQEGDMFPHTGFFRRGSYPAHAEMMEETTLIVIPIEQFEQTLICYPQLCIKLFRIMGEKIIELQTRLEELAFHNTAEQLARLFIRLATTNGVYMNGRYRLKTLLTTRELANMIGAARETVSRVLSQLKQQGIITTDDDGYYMIDVDALQQKR
ncbi:Crp/Fnr family transcriptional regulator [Anoxybacillus gonensis]|uniref:Crp/Fnr family transcriptional regulator n=1 Tax=Anoxybacillus gonensis TaxID=198467 RepID=A0AAW7TD83_9BACL|nr:Crp/Fnr family transcriptional regulator [Anoxybacillus gonensis]AKS38977.1 Crp/Fnr family transcriptional regulator [Anoxybacillus gonensis]KGP59921.1 Crp/Fnr family transcriptional regulator [Anoxybacillus gonensis]MDO0876084.1 Crp/Fnr family transcriptional regulator [Anoxybacillus gonensis]